MQTRHPVRAALFAALVPLVVILAFGNSWFVEHVVLDTGHSQLVDRLLRTLAPFFWTATPRRGDGAGTIWAALLLGAIVVVAATFLLVWLVARHAVGVSLWLGAWGVTVLAAMLGATVSTFVSYGAFFRNANPDGLGRFWHAVYQSQQVTLWGVWVGVVAGVLAAALVGGVDTLPPYTMSAPLPGATAWSQYGTSPYGAPQFGAVPTSGFTAAPAYVEQPTETAPAVPAEPQPTPIATRRAPGDPTVVMVQPTEWSAPPPPPPAQPEQGPDPA